MSERVTHSKPATCKRISSSRSRWSAVSVSLMKRSLSFVISTNSRSRVFSSSLLTFCAFSHCADANLWILSLSSSESFNSLQTEGCNKSITSVAPSSGTSLPAAKTGAAQAPTTVKAAIEHVTLRMIYLLHKKGASFNSRSAPQQKLADRSFGVIVDARRSGKNIRIAAAQRARRQAHGGGRQIHRLINHPDVLQHQGISDRLIFPGDALKSNRQHDQHLQPGRSDSGRSGGFVEQLFGMAGAPVDAVQAMLDRVVVVEAGFKILTRPDDRVKLQLVQRAARRIGTGG